MFKNIFDLLVKLISQPAKGWNILSDKQETNNEPFFKSYLYPLFGMIALLSFVGILFTQKQFDVQLALKTSIKALVTVFVGFYLASFLLSELMSRMYGQVGQLKLCQRFVGYSSCLIYILYLVESLFTGFFFLKIFILYTIYIIWEGATPYMNIDENQQLKFTVFASLIILLTPYLIEAVMLMLMPGLRA